MWTLVYVLLLVFMLLADRSQRDRVGIGALLVVAGLLLLAFLGAHHVLAEAYRAKVVVGTTTDWEYERPQGFLTPTNTPKIWFCEPVFRHESLYHAVLWLLPLVLLPVAQLLRRVAQPGAAQSFRPLLISATLLYPPYLLLSYGQLTNERQAGRFYVHTGKPRSYCPPEDRNDQYPQP